MPVDLRPRRTTRLITITRFSPFPYIIVFVLCAIIVIVGTRSPWDDGPAEGQQIERPERLTPQP